MITIGAVDIVHRPAGLEGACIDLPHAGASSGEQVLRIVGWALGREVPVERIEVGVTSWGVVAEAPVAGVRPDMEASVPANPHARLCGFEVAVPLLAMPPAFSLWVMAVDASGERHHIASIAGTRSALVLPPAGGPAPLMVTTLGRTGSTWLTHLLGAHPAILALEPFRVEPRVLTYWIDVFRTLAAPGSYMAPLMSTEPETEGWWLGRGRTLGEPGHSRELESWLASAHITDVATFCRDRISALYGQVAETSGAEVHAQFFVEKCNPSLVPVLAGELFPGAKEVFLVRDLRDRLASTFDYNRRKGYDGFGRGEFETDEAYVREYVLASASALLEAWRSRRERSLLVRYEDLVLEPAATAARMLSYLDLPDDPASVDSLLSDASMPDDVTGPHRTSSDAVASVGRWQVDLDESLQAVCQDALGEVLSAFGYDVGEARSV